MHTRTSICLWFDGKAAEAAEFHTSQIPNSGITSFGQCHELSRCEWLCCSERDLRRGGFLMGSQYRQHDIGDSDTGSLTVGGGSMMNTGTGYVGRLDSGGTVTVGGTINLGLGGTLQTNFLDSTNGEFNFNGGTLVSSG